MSENMEFKSKIFVSGTIKVLTGLHIGGSSVEMGIGGADLIVIRNPMTNHPYIPGSSIRGKMRSLIERTRGEMEIKFEHGNDVAHHLSEIQDELAKGNKIKSAGPATQQNQIAAKLFGVAVDKIKSSSITFLPQRLLVRDSFLLNSDELEKAKNTDMPLTEVKTEVTIDRITSKANPRQIERVPAGAVFNFEFVLSLYGDDKESDYLGYLFECMELLQDDYLGGHGSRGYGRIDFNIDTILKKDAANYREQKNAESLEGIEIPVNLTHKKHLEKEAVPA